MGRLYRPSLDKISYDTDEYPMPPCTQVNPDIFTEYESRFVAQKICMGCPFRSACLKSALNREVDLGGVYGGMTEADRRYEKRIKCVPVATK
jgi:hypothetical protein